MDLDIRQLLVVSACILCAALAVVIALALRSKARASKTHIQKTSVPSVAQSLAAYLPWAELYEDGTYLTKVPDTNAARQDTLLLATWAVSLPDSGGSAIRAADTSRALAEWLHLHETGATYWFDMLRVGGSVRADENALQTMDEASAEIEAHRQEIFSDPTRNYRNIWYFTCGVRVDVGEDGVPEHERSKAAKYFSEFDNMLMGTASSHERIGGERLLSYLASLCSSTPRRRVLPADHRTQQDKQHNPVVLNDMSGFLCTESLDVSRPLVLNDDTLVQPLTLSGFPDMTCPDMLEGLLSMGFRYRMSIRWTPYSNYDSQKTAKKMKSNLSAGVKGLKTLVYETATGEQTNNFNAQAVTDTDEAEKLQFELTHNETLGQLTMVTVLMATSYKELEAMSKSTLEQVRMQGFDMVTEKSACLAAWLGTMPGDVTHNRRRPYVSATNLSHILPYNGLYQGSPENRHMRSICGVGYPHVLAKTLTDEPYYLNLNGPTDDVGHTLVVGATGAGKSVLLSLLATQWMRYPNSRVILFDKDMSFANICRRCNGSIYIPANADSPLSFMPLARIRENPAQAIEWIRIVVESSGTPADAQMMAEVSEVCRTWDATAPTLGRFLARLRGTYPANRAIDPITRLVDDKDLGKLFGAEVDTFGKDSFARITMVEMDPIMRHGDDALLPTLQFLFDRMDELFDERPAPTLLVMDEAWKFLGNEMFLRKVMEWLRTLRKKLVFVVFALQDIAQVEADNLAEVAGACHTQVFTPNPMIEDTYDGSVSLNYRRLGLADEHLWALRHGRRKRDYLVKQAEGTALVSFEVDKFQIQRLARDGR